MKTYTKSCRLLHSTSGTALAPSSKTTPRSLHKWILLKYVETGKLKLKYILKGVRVGGLFLCPIPKPFRYIVNILCCSTLVIKIKIPHETGIWDLTACTHEIAIYSANTAKCIGKYNVDYVKLIKIEWKRRWYVRQVWTRLFTILKQHL